MGDDKNHLYSKEDYQKDQQENAKRRTQQPFSRFSVTAATSLNDAGNTQAPEAMQIDTRNSWFREINDTFASIGLQTVDVFFGTDPSGDRNNVTYNIYEVTDDVTFAFSGTPYGKMLPFTLDLTINKAVNPPEPVITWSASLINPPVLTGLLSNGTRIILHFETVQDAVSERQIFIGGNSVFGGGGGSQTPWLSDIDADGFDLFDISNIVFRESTGPPFLVDAIWVEGSNMHFNVRAGNDFIWEVNDSEEMRMSNAALLMTGIDLDMNSNVITRINDAIWIQDATLPLDTVDFIAATATNFIINADSGNTISLQTGKVDKLTISPTIVTLGTNVDLDMNSNLITQIDSAIWVQDAILPVATVDYIAATATNFIINAASGNTISLQTGGVDKVTIAPSVVTFGTGVSLDMAGNFIDMNTGIITQIDDLIFIQDGTLPLSTVNYIAATVDDFFFNAPAGDQIKFRINGQEIIEIAGPASSGQVDIHTDLDMNTNDVVNADRYVLSVTSAASSILDRGMFAPDATGGVGINILNNQSFTIEEEEVIRVEVDTAANDVILSDMDLNILDVGSGTLFSISKSAVSAVIFEQNKITFQIGAALQFDIEDALITFADGKGIIANIDQLGFRTLGNIIEDTATTMVYKVIPTGEHIFGDGTTVFMDLDTNRAIYQEFYFQWTSRASPGVTGAANIGRLFMDSANSHHLSIIRNGSIIDLETVGGGQTPWTSDIDAADFSLNNLDKLEFNNNVDTPVITQAEIYYNDATTGMNFNAKSGDEFTYRFNGVINAHMSATSFIFTGIDLDMNSNVITQINDAVWIQDGTLPIATVDFIAATTTNFIINADTGNSIALQTGKVDKLTIAPSVITVGSGVSLDMAGEFIDMNTGIITQIDDLVFVQDGTLPLSTVDFIAATTTEFLINADTGNSVTIQTGKVDKLIISPTNVTVGTNVDLHMDGNVIDMETGIITQIDDLVFVQDATLPLASVNYIAATTSHFVFNAPTGDTLNFRINNVSQLRITDTEVDMQANALIDVVLNADGTGVVITNIGSSEIKSEIITGQATVTGVAGDFVLISDTTDAGNLKKVDVNDFLAGAPLTPWTEDIDADGFDLNDLSNILFRDTTGAPIGTDTAIWRENAGDLHFNVPSTKEFIFEVNDTIEYQMDAGVFDVNGNNIAQVDTILFTNAVTTIASISSGLEFRIGTTKDYAFFIDGTEEYTFNATTVDYHSNTITNIGNITTVNGQSLLSSGTDWIMAVPVGDVIIFTIDGTPEMRIIPGSIDFEANALIDGTLDLADITVTGSTTEFNIALQSESFAFIGAANVFTGINTFTNNVSVNANFTMGDADADTHSMLGTLEIEDRTVPANPADATSVKLFLNSVTGELSVQKFSVGTVSLEGGGGLSDPIKQKLTTISSGAGAKTIDATLSNVFYTLLTASISITAITDDLVSGSPYQLFHFIVDQNGTGGFDITSWPASVNGIPFINKGADERTEIIMYTEDQGVNWYFTIPPVAGGGASQTPILTDIDYDGFDIQDISNVEFRDTTGAPAAGVRAIWYADATGMNFNALTGDFFAFSEQGTEKVRLGAKGVLFPNALTAFAATDVGVQADANGLIFNVDTPDDYTFLTGATNAITMSATLLDLNGNYTIQWNGTPDRRIFNDTSGFIFEVQASDVFRFEMVGVPKLRILTTGVDFEGGDITDLDDINFTASHSITSNADDLTINVESASPPSTLFLAMDGIAKYSFIDTTFTLTDLANPMTILFDRNDSTPTDDDILGTVLFRGSDSTPSNQDYAKIEGIATDVTVGSEAGVVKLSATIAGAFDATMTFGVQGIGTDVELAIRNEGAQSFLALENNDTVANDVGAIEWRHRNSLPAMEVFGSITVDAIDITDGSEDAAMEFRIKAAGVNELIISLDGQNGSIIISGTGAGAEDKLAFHGHTPVAHQTVSGSTAGNVALQNLLAALDALGLINDTTT